MSSKDYAAALANPFDGPVSGVIDEFGGKTVAFRINQTQLLSTTAGVGYTGAVIKTTNLSGIPIQTLASDAAGTTFVASAVPLEGAADLIAHYDTFRPVSMGVKVYYTGAEATTAGTVSVAVVNGVTTYNDFPSDFDSWFNLPDSHTVACASMTEPIVAICHSYDRPRFSSWTATTQDLFFPAIGVWGAGLPANVTGVLRMEISWVVEAIPMYGSVLTQHQAAVTPSDPVAMSIVQRRLAVARVGGPELFRATAGVAGAKRKTGAGQPKRKRRPPSGHVGIPVRRTVPMGRRPATSMYKPRRKKRGLFKRRR